MKPYNGSLFFGCTISVLLWSRDSEYDFAQRRKASLILAGYKADAIRKALSKRG